jgi:hypothetical protein
VPQRALWAGTEPLRKLIRVHPWVMTALKWLTLGALALYAGYFEFFGYR